MKIASLREEPALFVDRQDLQGLLAFAEGHKKEILSDFDACWNTGWAITKMGRPVLAEPFLVRAIEVRPDHPMGPYALAFARYIAGGQLLDEAESLYKKSFGMKEGWAARHGLAVLLLERGRAVEGEAILREGVRVRPKSRVRLEELADYLDDVGKLEEAGRLRKCASLLQAKK